MTVVHSKGCGVFVTRYGGPRRCTCGAIESTNAAVPSRVREYREKLNEGCFRTLRAPDSDDYSYSDDDGV